MIIDFAQAGPDPQWHEADLCIVGAGAAGIALALEFVGGAVRVLLVEGGGATRDAATDDLYRGGMAPGGKFHEGIHDGRARVFGGTTTLWGGQARPLAPIDFEARDWVADSGWPIAYDDLLPYHQRAGAIMGLRDVDFDEDLHRVFGVPRPGFDPTVIEHIYSRWSPQPNFAVAYRRRLAEAENVRVLQGANVTRIKLATDGPPRVAGLELRSLWGRSATVRAKAYVICCGGIETARLLLASNREQPAGVGNAHDLVGRYFQDHLSVRWADFVPSSRARTDALFNSFFRGRTKYYPLLSAGEGFQRRRRTLNISAAVVMDPVPDAGLEAGKRLFRAALGRRFGDISRADLARLLAGAPSVLRVAWRIAVRHRSYADPRAPLFLGSTLEQEPNPQSRVTLGTEMDALGMPRAVMDWRLTPLVRQTLAAFAGEVRAEFERTGLGRVNLHPWLQEEDDDWAARMRDVYHHIGTTRMHADPRRGVVDADCRVHGLDNLYLASSSVFPTGGHSNPTFTLLLLCFRLADRLKKSLG